MESATIADLEMKNDAPEHSLSSIRKFVFSCILITSLCLFTGIGMAEQFDLKVVLGIGVVVVFFLAVFLFGKVMKQAKERELAIQEHVENLELERKAQKKANKELLVAQGDLGELNSSLEQAFESLQESAIQSRERAKEIEAKSTELERLTEESDTIFNSIDNGVCLLSKNYKIGTKVSLSMYEIFVTDVLTGINFVSLMKPLITEKEAKTLADFLELQFDGKTLSKQLDKFNPLKKIEVTLNWNGDQFATKHLGFKFQRVMDGDNVGAVLVSVSDLTEAVTLENELKKSAQDQERKTAIILEMLNSGSSRLLPFLEDAEGVVTAINESLKSLESDNKGMSKEALEEVYRNIHRIKGNAGLLGLQSVAELSHEFETELSGLIGQQEVAGDQLLGSLVQLASLRELLAVYKDVSESIFDQFIGSSVQEVEEDGELVSEIKQFTETLSQETHKLVEVRTDIDTEGMTSSAIENVMSIITQCVRNSMAHGIESPESRLVNGKLARGLINIISRPVADNEEVYQLIIKDDGAGLDIESIKDRAIERNLVTREEASLMADSKAAGLIFKSGFSTTDEVTTLAGRGVGMEMIKDLVISTLKGNINMRYAKGQYMMLSIELPMRELVSDAVSDSEEMEVKIA